MYNYTCMSKVNTAKYIHKKKKKEINWIKKKLVVNHITSANVSKAWSAAFSPPLLTKASSFSLSSLTFSSLSSEAHTVRPTEHNNTHTMKFNISFRGKRQLHFEDDHILHKSLNWFFNDPLMKFDWTYSLDLMDTWKHVVCDVIWITTVIYSRVNIPCEHDTALSEYLCILNWASARLHHPVLELIFFNPDKTVKIMMRSCKDSMQI